MVRSAEESEDVPHHSVGEVIQLLNKRLEEPVERSFRVVDVSPPVLVGFQEYGMSMQLIHVLVTDADTSD
jgi:hypothetical protein